MSFLPAWFYYANPVLFSFFLHHIGSYDHKAKLFDLRTKKSVLTVEHGHPIESVLMFPSGGIFLTAGKMINPLWLFPIPFSKRTGTLWDIKYTFSKLWISCALSPNLYYLVRLHSPFSNKWCTLFQLILDDFLFEYCIKLC